MAFSQILAIRGWFDYLTPMEVSVEKLMSGTIFTYYSHLSNKHGGWNKRGQVAKL